VEVPLIYRTTDQVIEEVGHIGLDLGAATHSSTPRPQDSAKCLEEISNARRALALESVQMYHTHVVYPPQQKHCRRGVAYTHRKDGT